MKLASTLAALLLIFAASRPALALDDEFAAPLSAAWNAPRTEEPGSAVTAPLAEPACGDGQALDLRFPGGTDPADFGPGFATELRTVAPRGYGVYEARLRTARASRATGLVSAFFTYFNDGIDHDLDGIVDNHEIDFEFLAAEPTAVYMTVWTGYQETGPAITFRKTTRKVDLRTGRTWQTPPGGEGSWDIVETDPLPWTAKKYRSWRTFATYRFDWSAGGVAYSIDLGDGQGFRTLWTFTGNAGDLIPSIPAPLFFNLWHNATHWNTGAASRVPKKDASFRIDRVSMPD